MKALLKHALVIGAFSLGWTALLVLLYVSGVNVPHAKYFAKLPLVARIRPQPLVEQDPNGTTKTQTKGAAYPGPTWTDAQAWIPDDLRLHLPKKLFATPGQEMSLYVDNIVLTPWPDALMLQVTGPIAGRIERRRWVITPTASQVGEYPLSVALLDIKGKEVVRGKTTLCVQGTCQSSPKLRILIVGDSITHAGVWVDELSKLLDGDKALSYELLGTNLSPTRPRVKHEAYGGWTYGLFLSHHEPGSAKIMQLDRSPFVFPTGNGKGAIDVARYFQEQCGGRPPDIVVFALGMNDIFCLRPDQTDPMRKAMDEVADQASELVANFRKAAPGATLGILMPPQFSTSQPIFRVHYAAEFSRWRNRQLNHAWLEKLTQRFQSGDDALVSLIPTYASFDAIDGYQANDPGHPNELGSRQYAVSVYAWMKSVVGANERHENVSGLTPTPDAQAKR